MSLVHKVIILNKPLKIRGFTVLQWCILTVAVCLAFVVGTALPKDLKIGNTPLGLWVGIIIFGGAMGGCNAAEFKPFAWWRNLILYKLLNSVPKVYYPNVEEQTQVYPDPDVIDPVKRETDSYIELN